MIERHSTREVAPEQKREYWNHLVGQSYSGLVVDPLQPQFHATMLRWKMGEINLVRPRSAGAVIARRPPPGGAIDRRRLVLHIVQSGSLLLAHRGMDVILGPGDLVVCAGEEGYRFDVQGRHELLIVDVDRDRLADRLPGLDDRIGVRVPGSAMAVNLLNDFLLSLWREGVRAGKEVDAINYSDALTSLIVASLEHGAELRQVPAEPLFERMRGIVAARFGDPALSPFTMARELNVSLRTLQLCAARYGTTPTELLSEHRLGQAARRLADMPHTPVANVGYACGFADPAYFSRRFVRQYGISPSAYRTRH